MTRVGATARARKVGAALRAAHPGASRPAGALRAPMRGTECRAHLEAASSVQIEATCRTLAGTGSGMDAFTDVRLVRKSGGASGEWSGD